MSQPMLVGLSNKVVVEGEAASPGSWVQYEKEARSTRRYGQAGEKGGVQSSTDDIKEKTPGKTSGASGKEDSSETSKEKT